MKRTWGEYLATVILAIGAALLVRSFVLTAFKVPTGSMRPALLPGDFVFVDRLSYLFFSDPQPGELVALRGIQGTDVSYLKRIIGVEGDKIEFKQGILYLNDQPAQYFPTQSQTEIPNPEIFQAVTEVLPFGQHELLVRKDVAKSQFGPLVVPPGEVFLLGDNRDTSEDSRFWGTVPLNQIFGRVLLVWMSIEPPRESGKKNPRIRWNRIFYVPN